ncbi:MAG: hypothetical protein NVSMB65_16080 [Chloroflexota bacterium]
MPQNRPQSPPTTANLPQRRGEKGLETAATTITQHTHPAMNRFPDPLPVEEPGMMGRGLGLVQDYLFSEETLVLVEFILVLAIGIVGFTAAYQPIYHGVQGIHHLLTQSFGILK